MNAWSRWLVLVVLTTASVWWLSGCNGKTDTHPTGKAATPQVGERTHTDHKEGDHKEGDHKEGHEEKPLTEKDVQMPTSFKGGVARLEELHKTIEHHIEHGELDKVHRTAEEMALVARKMKEQARKDLPEDKQTEAGRLCNEVAGYYKPIDEVADAGNKPETVAIHKKMGATIEKLKNLTK